MSERCSWSFLTYQINVRGYRWENLKGTIQRNCQHRADKTGKKQKQKHNTICIGHHYALANTNIEVISYYIRTTTTMLCLAC